MLAARRRPGGKVGDFGDLWDTLVDARKGVGFVVDDDEQLQLVERQDARRHTILCHAASFRSSACILSSSGEASCVNYVAAVSRARRHTRWAARRALS